MSIICIYIYIYNPLDIAENKKTVDIYIQQIWVEETREAKREMTLNTVSDRRQDHIERDCHFHCFVDKCI